MIFEYFAISCIMRIGYIDAEEKDCKNFLVSYDNDVESENLEEYLEGLPFYFPTTIGLEQVAELKKWVEEA
jgi:hypothetical protein